MTKRTYQINTNRGVDLSSSPLNVAPSRASYMRNMISKGGVNHKRNGWNEIASFKNKNGKELCINGIWEYVHPDTGDKSLIVYAGTQFFKCSYDFSTQENISIEADVNINDEKCKAYYKDGLLWIIGAGDYLVYDGTSIVRVEDSEYAYAPTTSIESIVEEQVVIESYEDVNLLTKKRKNKRIGVSGKYDNGFLSGYELDGLIDFSKSARVLIEISAVNSNDNEVAFDVYKEAENGELVQTSLVKTITLEYSIKENDVKFDYEKATYNGQEVFLYEKNTGEEGEKVEFEAKIALNNWANKTVLNCYFNAMTPMTGYNNITVEYYAGYKRSVELTKSAVFTQPNGVDLLLVANKDTAIFYSGLDSADCEYSFGYISAEKFITFGSDREPITAIVPMADSVGVFKGNSFYRVSFTFDADSETYEAEYVPQITEATDTNGCVNQFVSCNVNGDTLVFDGSGIYGIEYSSSQRSLKLRSSNIAKAFEQYSREKLESAIACHHEGRYYLFIDGNVYIADSRFKVYESNRLDTSFEYEWWIWDNCPATVVYSIEGKLYLGKDNGKIAVFDGEFSDREYLVAKSEKGVVNIENDSENLLSYITFDEALRVEDGDKIKIKGGYLQSCEVDVYGEKGSYKVELSYMPRAYIGQKVIIKSTNEKAEIIDYDYNDKCFVINAETCEAKEILLYEIDDEVFFLDKLSNGRYLIYRYDGGAVLLDTQDDFEIKILREQNVECEYHTPVLDLGSNLCLKTLNQLSITVSNDTEGQIEVGYQTNSNNRFMQRSIGAGFDFNDFNFNTLSFDCFYKTHVKRVFERNFNYILFKLASSSDKAFGVENFSCVYSSNNKLLKGDR